MRTDRRTVETVRRAVTHRKIRPDRYRDVVTFLALRLVSPDVTPPERARILMTAHRLRRRGAVITHPTQTAVLNASMSTALREPYRSGDRAQAGRLISLASIVIRGQADYLTEIARLIREATADPAPDQRPEKPA